MKYLKTYNKLIESNFVMMPIDNDWVECIEARDISMIENMIKDGYDINKLVYFTDDELDIAINYAAFYNHEDVIDILLKYNAELDIIVDANNTTAMKVSYNIHLDEYDSLKKIIERTPKYILFYRNSSDKYFIDYIENKKSIFAFFKKDFPEIYKQYKQLKMSKKFNL
jgi:hypothetical protein